MNKQIKTMWVKALRSGKYEQGEARLKTVKDGITRYCCLGVLCDLHAKETGKKWNTRPEKNDIYKGIRYGKYTNGVGGLEVLPNVVVKWAGVDDYNPDVNVKGMNTNLAGLNDSGVSFTEIARLIEKTL